MRCISPFDNGSYHICTNRSNRSNRTNRQLGEGSLDLQRVRNILSPPNEMHFSIRQRVVPHGHDSHESTGTAQLFYDSYLFRCIGQPSSTESAITHRYLKGARILQHNRSYNSLLCLLSRLLCRAHWELTV